MQTQFLSKYLSRGHSFVITHRTPLLALTAIQATLVFLGLTVLEFNISLLAVISVICAAIVSEFFFFSARKYLTQPDRPFTFDFTLSVSALAAGLGLAIFFRATSLEYFFLAGFLAIASKYLLVWDRGHIFNPSNFAIVTLLFLIPTATTVEMTQWATNPILFAAIAMVCLSVTYIAGKLPTTLAFLLTYLGGLTALLLMGASELQVHHYGLLSPTMILFAAFMITDPKTSPRGYVPGIIHGVSVALLYFCIESMGIRYALFLSSFIVTLLNFISRVGSELVFSKWKIPGYDTLFTFGIAAALFMALVGTTLNARAPNVHLPSLQFLLMGTESSRILSCDPNPQFEKTLPLGIRSTTGNSGLAWGDINNDGFDDIFVSSGDVPSGLYLNNGSGGFKEITHSLGIGKFYNETAFFVDYNNDSRQDLFLIAANSSTNRVEPIDLFSPAGSSTPVIRAFKNTGDGFSEVTTKLGLDVFKERAYTGTLSFADYDLDGYLDMAFTSPGFHFDVTPRERTALEKSVLDPGFRQPIVLSCKKDAVESILRNTPINGKKLAEEEIAYYVDQNNCIVGRSFIPLFPGHRTSTDTRITTRLFVKGGVHLFKNVDGRSFQEQTSVHEMIDKALVHDKNIDTSQMQQPFKQYSGRIYQPISFDANSDGMVDIFVAIDLGSNMLLINRGNFNFSIDTAQHGLDISGSGMGATIADFERRDALDLAVDNIRSTFIFKSRTGSYALESRAEAINPLGVGWGISSLDYDIDGWPDLLIVNGDSFGMGTNFNPEIDRPLFRVPRMYRNSSGSLLDDTHKLCILPAARRPAAVSDYDNDGDPDLFIGTHAGGPQDKSNPSELLVNAARKIPGFNSVSLRLVGTVSNRDAIGSRVTATTPAGTQTQVLLAGDSFYSQSSKKLLFGLGTSTDHVWIKILWPSGVQSTHQVAPNTTTALREPSANR